MIPGASNTNELINDLRILIFETGFEKTLNIVRRLMIATNIAKTNK